MNCLDEKTFVLKIVIMTELIKESSNSATERPEFRFSTFFQKSSGKVSVCSCWLWRQTIGSGNSPAM